MVLQSWRRLSESPPEFLFLVFAAIGGLALVALIPPMAGGNELFNFQRVAAIAAFHPMIEPAQIPSGILRFLQAAHDQFNPTRLPPYRYSSAQFLTLSSIPLDAATPATLAPNPISVLNPVAYVPQVAAYWLGEAFGWPPLWLFYLGRIAGLAAAIALSFFAIRRMPSRRYALCALALLPTIAFTRSTLDADQVTNGLCFLFVAIVLSAATQPARIGFRQILLIAATALLTAQCKTAYFVLLALPLAIPVERYGSRRRWLFATLAIAVPGALSSLAWMIVLKHGYFAGMHYYVMDSAVYPDQQVAMILADPLHYAAVLARSIFASTLMPMILLGILGIFGPPVLMPMIDYVLTLGAFVAALAAEGDAGDAQPTRLLRWIAIGVFLAGFGLTLTLVYIQWDGVGAPVISGFNGRYLYPLAPALLIFLPVRKSKFFGLGAAAWVVVLGLIAAWSTLSVTWTTYWA
jgi:uncharacterized membrane protein